MASIYDTATLPSKGQITLPKSIRQALGIDVGGKVAFEQRGDPVVVTRAEDKAHEDPARPGFLRLLERDIRAGRGTEEIPEALLRKMLSTLERPVDPNAEIEGDVALGWSGTAGRCSFLSAPLGSCKSYRPRLIALNGGIGKGLKATPTSSFSRLSAT